MAVLWTSYLGEQNCFQLGAATEVAGAHGVCSCLSPKQPAAAIASCIRICPQGTKKCLAAPLLGVPGCCQWLLLWFRQQWPQSKMQSGRDWTQNSVVLWLLRTQGFVVLSVNLLSGVMPSHCLQAASYVISRAYENQGTPVGSPILPILPIVGVFRGNVDCWGSLTLFLH